MELLDLVTRSTSFVAGMIIMFAALFAREREERLVQETLERWWINLDDAATRAIRAHARAEAVAAVHLHGYLQRMFGPRLMSLRSFASALAYATASLTFILTLILPSTWHCYSGCPKLLFQHIIALAVMLTAAVVSGLRPRISVLAAAVAAVAFLVCVRLTDQNTSVLTLGAVVVVGGTLILVWVAVTQQTFKWLGRSEHLGARLAVAIIHLATAPLLVLGPPAIGLLLVTGPDAEGPTWSVGLLAGCALLFVGIVSAAFVVAIVANVCHRLIWHALDRPLYAAQRHNVFVAHRKKLATLGAALSGIAIPAATDVLKHLF